MFFSLIVSITTALSLLATASHMGDGISISPKTVTLKSGTEIAWDSLGSGEPVILLNGTGSPMAEWDPAFLQQMSKGSKVIIFDYPGLGESSGFPKGWNFRTGADEVAELASILAPGEKVDILGWSMGGFIAQELMSHHPDVIDDVVLVGTNPGGRMAVLGPKWVQEADSDPSGSDETYLRTNYPDTDAAQRAGERFLARLDAAVTSGRYPAPRASQRAYRGMVGAEDYWLTSEANWETLRKYSGDVLIVVGEKDVITPPINSVRISDAIESSSLLIWPDAGHSVLFQKPKRTAEYILSYLVADKS